MSKIDLHDRNWANAIAHWTNGNAAHLEAKMRGTEPVPHTARAWLGDLVAGKVKKKRGRKTTYPSDLDSIRRYYFELRIKERFDYLVIQERCFRNNQSTGTPTETALALCAEFFGMTEDQISKIVFPRNKAFN